MNGWFIRAGSEGQWLERYRIEGIAGVSYGKKACFDLSGLTKNEIDEKLNDSVDPLIKEGYLKGERDNNADQLFDISRIKSGDLIAITPPGYGDSVEIFGIATSDYYFNGKDAQGLWHRVDVNYLGLGTDEFGQGTRKGIMRDASGRIEEYLGKESVNPTSPSDRDMVDVISDCSKWDKYTNENDGILERERNMIFYGPPGTGKTWTAKEIAECLCKKNGTLEERLVEEFTIFAADAGYEVGKPEGTRDNQKIFTLKKDGYQHVVGFHKGDGNANEKGESYFQVGNSDIKYFEENDNLPTKGGNFIVVFKETNQSFVCLPYDKEQENGQFVPSEDGNWDETGKRKHSMHNLFFTEEHAFFKMPSTNQPEKEGKTNVTEFLNTWNALNPTDQEETDNKKFKDSKRGCHTFQVTFHPSYSYEDFVEGFRPQIETSGANYKLAEGVFRTACEHAELFGTSKTVLIIDEINRGNIPKIFGELITLVEKDKRRKKYALNLTYSRKEFNVPDNLYIIGTMNTADKSLIQMDDALKRRFAFEELLPNVEALREHLIDEGVQDANNYAKILEIINKKILDHNGEQSKKQFRDRQIGHSYFWNIKNDDDLKYVIKYKIIPLLQDYFFSDYAQIRKVLGQNPGEGKDDYSFIGNDNRPTELVNEGKSKDGKTLKDALLELESDKK